MNQVLIHDIQCPYCWEWIEVLIDCSVDEQNYIEDCQVCCRPIEFDVKVDENGISSLNVFHENE